MHETHQPIRVHLMERLIAVRLLEDDADWHLEVTA